MGTEMTTYKNTNIVRTDVVCLDNGRKLYSLTGAVNKDATSRPLITSVKQAREFITSRVPA